MMTLNLCFESYGAAVHVMDSLLGVSAEQASRPLRHARFRRSAVRHEQPDSNQPSPDPARPVSAAFVNQVRGAANAMPFEQAHALWLVDVCQVSYDQAATESGVARDEFAARVAAGRRFIRDSITSLTPAAPVG